MNLDSRAFAPYFRNGLLYLPDRTVKLLIEAGLDRDVAQAALRGLALDTERQWIAEINRTLEIMLAEMEEDSQEFRALTTDEAQFILTGRPVART